MGQEHLPVNSVPVDHLFGDKSKYGPEPEPTILDLCKGIVVGQKVGVKAIPCRTSVDDQRNIRHSVQNIAQLSKIF